MNNIKEDIFKDKFINNIKYIIEKGKQINWDNNNNINKNIYDCINIEKMNKDIKNINNNINNYKLNNNNKIFIINMMNILI